MDNREAIARIIDRFSCTHWDAGAKHDLKAEILALLTRTEATTGEAERLREALMPFAKAAERAAIIPDAPLHRDAEKEALRTARSFCQVQHFQAASVALAQPVQDEGGKSLAPQ